MQSDAAENCTLKPTQRGAIHVYCCADGQNETRNTSIDAQILLEASIRDRQCYRRRGGAERRYPRLKQAAHKYVG